MFDALLVGDPLADAAVEGASAPWIDVAAKGDAPAKMPQAMRELVRHCSEPPSWVDWERCDSAGRLLFRSGIAGGIVLGARSLIGGYAAPAGNKPLAFSGGLSERVQFRLAETGRFVVATCTPRSLRPGGDGWGVTLRVRLMHAKVRQMLQASPRWTTGEWGVPINQHDMVGTSLLFSTVFVDGIRMFGVPVSTAEEEDYVHLWRTSGWLMGVDEAVAPKDNFESYRLGEFIRQTQAPPDEDSRALTRALLESPRLSMTNEMAQKHISLGQGFARALLGEELADGLGVSKTPHRFVVPAVGALVRAARVLAPPGSRARFEEYGRRYWARNVETGLAGRRATFSLPDMLLGTPQAA